MNDQDHPPEEIRIQKWLSMLGICSRREAEKMIQDKRVSLNGKILDSFGVKVRPGDAIKIDGKLVKNSLPPKVYYMLNKPDFSLVTRKSEDNKPTIFELQSVKNIKYSLFSVGRLDFRTEGLLLLSNDGEFVQKLTHPSNKIPRSYQVLINGKITNDQKTQLKQGITLEDGPIKGVKIHMIEGMNLGASKGAWYQVTVFEGRNRLIRRLFEFFGLKVIKLLRTDFGSISLPPNLIPGKVRSLSKEELKALK